MASGGMDDLCECFSKFASLAGSKDGKMFTPKASGKLVGDCWNTEFKKYDVKSVVDASVMPKCKERGQLGMPINGKNCEKYVTCCAHELAKRKTKNNKLPENDNEVTAIKTTLCSLLKGGGPNVKEVKQSKTGNVGSLTDASKYTGAHKERFDADGKGKGTDGREDRQEHTGYTGQYKNQGSYGKK